MSHKNSLSCRALALPLLLSVALGLSGCVSTSPAPVVDHSSGGSRVGQSQPVGGPGFHTVKKGDTLYSLALEYGQDYRDVAGWNNITDPNVIAVGQVLRVLPPQSEAPAVVTAPIDAGAPIEQRPLDGAPPLAALPVIQTNTALLKHEPRVNKEPYSDALYASLQKPVTAQTASAPPVVTTPTTTSTTPTPAPAAVTTSANATDGLNWAWPANGKVIGNFAQTKGVDIGGQAGDAVLAAADGRVVYTGNSLRGYGNLVIIKHNANYLTAYAHNRKILVKEQQEVKRGAKIAEMGKTDSEVVKLHFEVRRQGTPVEPLNYLPRK
jgi:lipoprotein NlpD